MKRLGINNQVPLSDISVLFIQKFNSLSDSPSQQGCWRVSRAPSRTWWRFSAIRAAVTGKEGFSSINNKSTTWTRLAVYVRHLSKSSTRFPMSPPPKYMHRVHWHGHGGGRAGHSGSSECADRRGAARRGADSPSLWNINMTRNIISHDSRRHGNTKYYPAKSSDRLAALCSRRPGGCVLPLAAARRTCTGHGKRGDKLAFARHDAAKSVRACERASERITDSAAFPQRLPDRVGPTCAKRSFSAPVICARVWFIVRAEFSRVFRAKTANESSAPSCSRLLASIGLSCIVLVRAVRFLQNLVLRSRAHELIFHESIYESLASRSPSYIGQASIKRLCKSGHYFQNKILCLVLHFGFKFWLYEQTRVHACAILWIKYFYVHQVHELPRFMMLC